MRICNLLPAVTPGCCKSVRSCFFAFLLALFFIPVVQGRNLPAVAFLQTKTTITGKVTNEKGEPLPNVTVQEKGTTVAATTDEKGAFSINVSNSKGTLVFSSVGYTDKEMPLNNRTDLGTIVLQASAASSLDEVVVVGYGTQKKKEITSAIASVKAEDFNKGGVVNPLDLIQGKVAGLTINQTQGSNPNAATSIQLRGITTLKGSVPPLIVVDGIPGGNLDLIQQNDIESMDILKDGSAAAIYGTRANGGVILITTKKGKSGDPTFEFGSYVQREFVDKRPHSLSAAQFRDLIKQGKISDQYDFGGNADLYDALINKNNLSQYYTLAASGGTAKANYRGSVYSNTLEGIAKDNDRKEFGGRINFNQTGLKDRLTLQMNIATNINKANLMGGGAADWEPDKPDALSNFEQAVQWNPTASLYQPDGSFTQLEGFNMFNPLSRLAYRTMERDQQTFSGDAKVTVKIVKGLSGSVFGSYQRNMYTDRYFRSSQDWDQRPQSQYKGMSYASKSNWLDWSKTLEGTLNYNTTFADRHKIEALAGYSYQYSTFEYNYLTNNGFSTDAYQDWNMGAGSAINNTDLPRPGLGSHKEDNTLVAFFGRVNYSFDNKYFLQGILRHEGSSRFGANNKWGNFPAVSAGWTISNEDFMKAIPAISNLKLRVGYGVTGNQGIDNYQSLYTLSTGGVYPQDGMYFQTYGPERNVNPNLKWEKKAELNFGLDYGLLNNRINGSLDVYSRKTSDLLYQYNVPQPPFTQPDMWSNVGAVSSKGVELMISALALDKKDFKWNVTFTGSSNFNRLTRLSNDQFKANYLEFGGLPSPGNLGNAIRIKEGSMIGDFYGKRFAGFTSDGEWQFYKADGSIGGTADMNAGDLTVIGNGVPKYMAALSNRFSYKGFDLTIFFRGKFKFDILNTPDLYFGNKKWLPNNVLESAIGKYNGINDDPQYSDYYLEKGDFVKLDNVTLGYNFRFKTDWVKRLYIYATGRNLATFTKYSGLDPELEDTGFTTGIDNRGFYPRTRSWTLGLNISF
ncbi:SusC/RagA family TonB-linked outer membrane protein [Niabella ginsenosidivorans]|uniref:SusC/RagA family TonB-linked outer membrane protein n=1 Tax=Niabella ginsenosidivorans TaxID=1176587 RepID=UPI000A001CFF|nr:SusC/RagA family TonB-linked outer membrane protein [Niabella ginsenosidivorans]